MWAAINLLNAHANYARSAALPAPTEWAAILGPALGAIATLQVGRTHVMSRAPNLPRVLDALATLVSSDIGVETKALASAIKAKGFPPRGSVSVTFTDGSTQTVDWGTQAHS